MLVMLLKNKCSQRLQEWTTRPVLVRQILSSQQCTRTYNLCQDQNHNPISADLMINKQYPRTHTSCRIMLELDPNRHHSLVPLQCREQTIGILFQEQIPTSLRQERITNSQVWFPLTHSKRRRTNQPGMKFTYLHMINEKGNKTSERKKDTAILSVIL